MGATVWAWTAIAAGQEWTRFRGPNGTGRSDATSVPVQWTEADLNWKVKLPGIGHSSPVLWGDKIFLTSAMEETATRLVICLRASDGGLEWKKEYPSQVHEKHIRNSFASATPCVDEERVYVCWSTPVEYTLVALDHQGNQAWHANLGAFESQHSCGTSPIVVGDLVILNNDQDGPSSLVALDRRTGKTAWEVKRRTEKVAYSTPCLYEPSGGPRQLIFNSWAHGITSIDPATGKTLWEMGELFDKRTVSSPVEVAGLIIGTCGSGGGGNYVVAVRPGSSDPAKEPEEVYRISNSAPYVPTPVSRNDLLFLWSDQGVVTCVDGATGKTVWLHRVGGAYSGSPVCVGGKLYAIAEDGVVYVIDADREFEMLATNPLGEASRSTPAVAGGRMYLRTYSHLTSVGGG